MAPALVSKRITREETMDDSRPGKLILVVIEDLNREAMEEASTPNMDVLIQAGSFGYVKHALPTSPDTPPLFGILTSRESLSDPFSSAESRAMSAASHTLIGLARCEGRSTAGFFNHSRFNKLFHLYGTFDRSHPFARGQIKHRRDRFEIVTAAANEISSFRPDLCLIHLDCMEHLGYRPPIMSSFNVRHTEMADRALGVLMNTMSMFGLFGEYHVLLTGDMGDRFMNARYKASREVSIPWLAFGPRIKRGFTIARSLSTLDTTPTAAELMNLPRHHAWLGEPIREMIQDPDGRNDFRRVA